MASRTRETDPRLELGRADESSIEPVVALPRAGPSTLMIVMGAVVAGLILFVVLDARRREAAAPAVRVRASEVLTGVAPPPALQVPVARPVVIDSGPPVPAPPPLPREAPAPRIVYVPQPTPPAQPIAPVVEQVTRRSTATGPALVVDTSAPLPTVTAGQAAAANPTATITGTARARSGMFANNATTVPQGTIIQAVLETALDSTRPGFARAIVSRDVRGFDGSRVLIPRGSRLIGEYRSDAAPGQRRALVNWIRLIRPDGVTIAIGSPAADPLGRGGIRAQVNTHFFERFAGAMLQSTFDIGVALAARGASGSTVVLLPGAVQGVASQASQIIPQRQITNTLTVRQATSISIFAARDLDFTDTEERR